MSTATRVVGELPPTDTSCRISAQWAIHNQLWPILISAIDDKSFPEKHRGKAPLGGKNWGKDRHDLRWFNSSFNRHPKASVGLLLGPDGGVIDIDVDVPEEAAPILERIFPDGIPPTLGWKNLGGKFHLLFLYDPRLEKYTGKTGIIKGGPHYPGLEIRIGRADKQIQSVIPPSLLPNGVRRKWNGNEIILPLPESVFADLEKFGANEKPRKATPAGNPGPRPSHGNAADVVERASRYLAKCEPAIDGEDGSGKCLWAACKMVEFGLDYDTCLRLLMTEYNMRCKGPWSEEEMRHKLDAAFEKAERGAMLKTGRNGHPGPAGTEIPIKPSVNGHAASNGDGHQGNGTATASADERPSVEISPERHEVVAAAVAALTRDPEIYCRGESLVVVAREETDAVKLTAKTILKRMAGAPKIVELSDSNVGCVLTRNAEFIKWQKDESGEDVAVRAHPPDWCIKAVATRKYWHDMRRLVSVVECPYPRADGSIVETPGYDDETGTLYIPSMEFPPVPDRPTQEDAKAAAKMIGEVFKEFPLASEDDRVVPLAALLTVIARPAIDGSVPGFAFNGNRAGTGKGLLINAIGRIAYGRDVATSNYPDDKIEAQKVKVSIALQAPIAVHFDNLDEGSFYGNSALDSMITAGTINDRILGSSKHTGELPVRVVPMLSGNNVSPGKDAHRRWLVGNLRTELERPEERKDFKVKDLRAHVSARRGELVQAALTILKAHALAGWPTHKDWAALGSFEEWDKVVRGAVWYAAGRDCTATRRKAADEAPARKAKIALLSGWSELPGGETSGVTAAKAVELATKDPEKYATLYNSLVHFGKAGKLADGRGIGNIIRGMKGCLTEGMKFVEAGEHCRAVLWKVSKTEPNPPIFQKSYESDESDESATATHTRDSESHNYVNTSTLGGKAFLAENGKHSSDSSDSSDSPAEEERLGVLTNNGMSNSGIRNFLDGAKTHGDEIRDLLPRIISGGMWRDFVFVNGERHRWGRDDFREFLEAPRPRGGCESSLALIERLIGGTPAWAAVQAVIASGDDETPPASPDVGRAVANGEAIRKLRTVLSLARYCESIPKMFLRMVKEGSWRKYLTRNDRDEIQIHRRDGSEFLQFLSAPWPDGLGSSPDIAERVLRDTEAWPVYQGLIGRDGGLH